MDKRQVKIKTSVCLPENIIPFYRSQQQRLLELAAASRMLENLPSRNRARSYNRQAETLAIVQVYWPLEAYNKLHAIAAALRVSVSLLIYWMLLLMENEPETQPEKFSNYSLIVKSWSVHCIHIEEKIQFQPHDPEDDDIPLAA